MRQRPAKTSKLAKTRKAFRLARLSGALVHRSSASGRHVYYVVLPEGMVWIASANRDLWFNGVGFGSASDCADVDILLAKIQRGVRSNE